MPSYAILGKYTEQGIKDAKNTTDRLQAAKDALKDAGGRMIFFYLTMGEYDFIALAEVPDDETAAGFLLAQGARGNVTTTTLRAFTEEETASITAALP
ncbi:MAG TPA: GYD domain-containing protein [Dehalococcoidia bacterium]|nr:GYD domain-containing protein [Dehalococcoidia bacterium]